jgi:hypothetical protein
MIIKSKKKKNAASDGRREEEKNHSSAREHNIEVEETNLFERQRIQPCKVFFFKQKIIM